MSLHRMIDRVGNSQNFRSSITHQHEYRIMGKTFRAAALATATAAKGTRRPRTSFAPEEMRFRRETRAPTYDWDLALTDHE